MMLNEMRFSFTLLTCLSMAVVGCGGGGDDGSGTAGTGGTGGSGPLGCIQPNFPAEQPDLSVAQRPIFLLTNAISQQSQVGQAQVDPGDPIEAQVTVDAETRQVIVELANAWLSGEEPRDVIHTETFETAGNETIDLLLFSPGANVGRYYMRLTLCGFDCNEQKVVFDINPDINSPYERTVIEGGEVIQIDRTCIKLNPRPNIGSGTILIQ